MSGIPNMDNGKLLASLCRGVGRQCLPALVKVLQERGRQNELYPNQDHDPFIWLGVLSEEVGEFSAEALANRFSDSKHHRLNEMEEECIQVAAVALAMVECIRRKKWKWGS